MRAAVVAHADHPVAAQNRGITAMEMRRVAACGGRMDYLVDQTTVWLTYLPFHWLDIKIIRRGLG